jgi:hypothetical protein
MRRGDIVALQGHAGAARDFGHCVWRFHASPTANSEPDYLAAHRSESVRIQS